MKRKNATLMIVFGLILSISLSIHCSKDHSDKSGAIMKDNSESTRTVHVEKVILSPEQYKGYLKVNGIIIKIEESQDIFLLGCEDACVSMPVKYSGEMPEVKSDIVVYGEIKKQEDGRYLFQADEVKKR